MNDAPTPIDPEDERPLDEDVVAPAAPDDDRVVEADDGEVLRPDEAADGDPGVAEGGPRRPSDR